MEVDTEELEQGKHIIRGVLAVREEALEKHRAL
jgi:hypothetical protein